MNNRRRLTVVTLLAQSRQAAIAALDGAVRNHEEARRDYNRLRS